MSKFLPPISGDQVLIYDPDADSRQRLAQQINSLGYRVLTSGNNQVVSQLLKSTTLGGLIISTDKFRLSLLAVIGEIKGMKPELPIVVILSDTGGNMPVGLADAVLIDPNQRTLAHVIHQHIDGLAPMAVAS